MSFCRGSAFCAARGRSGTEDFLSSLEQRKCGHVPLRLVELRAKTLIVTLKLFDTRSHVFPCEHRLLYVHTLAVWCVADLSLTQSMGLRHLFSTYWFGSIGMRRPIDLVEDGIFLLRATVTIFIPFFLPRAQEVEEVVGHR